MPTGHDQQSPSVSQLVEELFIKLYSPPLLILRERLDALPEAIQILVLIADFDTEVSMNGLFGFLENSGGAKLPETIAAFRKISANATAARLESVQQVMSHHGITHSMLRERLGELQPYTVASIVEIHGLRVKAMSEEVSALAKGLYVDNPSSEEDVIGLLCRYVEPHRSELLKVASAA